MEIMAMKTGTRIKHAKSKAVYVLGDYVNEVAREIISTKYAGVIDYINKNTQNDYIVERTCENGI